VSATFQSAVDVQLVVDGQVHRGWRAMKAITTLDAPCAKFTLELAERWADAEDARPRTVKPGASCQLLLGGDLVVDGWVDAVEVIYDERDHVLTVVARDKVCDLVDCAAVLDGPHEWTGLKLDEIARRLAAPYGVTVEAEVDVGAAFPRFAIQPGETAWEALSRAATARGVLVAGDGTGRLRLTRAGQAQRRAAPIVLGENVQRARGVFDHARRYSTVCVRGQGEGGGSAQGIYDDSGATPVLVEGGERTLALRGEGRASDAVVRRFRPRVIVAEAAGDARGFAARALWEVRHAAGDGTRVAYTVPGWRAADGKLWRVGELVPVSDPWLGIEAELLVATVIFSLTPSDGSVTEVEVTLPDAYEVREIPVKQTGGAAGAGGQGLFDDTDGTPRRVPLPAAA
jgi:prophage tail gpP-like protein